MFYAGRVANLVFAVAVAALAIRLTPIYRRVLAAIALTPITLCLFGAVSADAPTIALTFLLTAIFFRAAAGRGRLPAGALAAMFLLGPLVGLCKLPYAVVTLLYLAIPHWRIGSRLRYLTVGMFLAALSFSPGFVWLRFSEAYHAETHSAPGYVCCRTEQMQHVLCEPLAFLGHVWETCIERGKICLDHATLPSFATYNPLAWQALATFLVVLAVLDGAGRAAPPPRLRILGLGTAMLALALIFFCQYLWWTPVGAKLIGGWQGRYLVPLVPLFLLALAEPAIDVRAGPCALTALTAAVCSSALAIAVAACVQRYWIARPLPILSAPGMAAMGLAFTTSVWLLARRTLDRPEPGLKFDKSEPRKPWMVLDGAA
jgi:uncharacterized membrane protein